MRWSGTGIGLAGAAAGSLALLWMTDIPLGVPGQWEWKRLPVEAGDALPLLLGWVLAGAAAILYVGFVALGGWRIERAGRKEASLWLLGLSAAGFLWLWAVQESPPHLESEMAKSAWVLFYPGTEGYFDRARHDVKNVPSYLAEYEGRMSAGDVLHFGTHPPGLILLHRWGIELCAASPRLRKLLLETQPASFREALDVTQETERGGFRALTEVDRAALWLAALATQSLAAATVIPLYGLVRRSYSRATSWWTAALWPLVPALAIFLPKSDALFPFLGALFLWCWLEGLARRSFLLCCTAGVILWGAMFLSLAILPIAFAAGLLTIWETLACAPSERIRLCWGDWARCLSGAVAGWVVPVLLFRLASVNLLAIWSWNYRNHAAFYSQYPRTYWKWLLVNPVELCLAVGAPVFLAVIFGYRSTIALGWRRRGAGPFWCLGAAWLVLWLSGKNMGEAARLWLVILPWPIWLAARFLENGVAKSPFNHRRSISLLVAQIVVAIGTVTRVTGFPDLAGKTVAQEVPAAKALAAAAVTALGPTPPRASRVDEQARPTR